MERIEIAKSDFDGLKIRYGCVITFKDDLEQYIKDIKETVEALINS